MMSIASPQAITRDTATAWPASNGVLAQVTFQVQSGATNAYAWPLVLRRCEITPDGYANRFLLPSGAVLIGRNPVPGFLAALERSFSNQFQFLLTGDPNASYTVEVSTNLVNWAPFTNIVNTTGTFPILDPDASHFPDGWNATARTSPPWPARTRGGVSGEARSQSRMAPSALPAASKVPLS